MAHNHGSHPTLSNPASDSYTTHCSLRRPDSEATLHPPKQNPPSVASTAPPTELYDVDLDGPLRPPPSALTTAATHYDPHELPSPLENFSPRIGQGHQRSLTGTFLNNCQPFLSRATSTIQQHTSRASLHSPTKSLASFIPSRSAIESTASQPKIKAGAKALQNWFNGSSAPVNLGVAAPESDSEDEYDSEEEDEEPTVMASLFSRGPSLTGPASPETTPTPKRTPTSAKTQTSTSTANSRFAWLLSTQKTATVPSSTPSPIYHNPDDELLNLNISQSLFPHGPVDPLAPSSFNDLLSSAESLLSRYQTSYRQISTALSDARAETSAQEDELDETNTRVRHLKMQLETMAARANEQDAQMQRLVEDLSFERRARQEAEAAAIAAARRNSIALSHHARTPAGYNSHADEQHSSNSPHRSNRRNRHSGSEASVDSGFDSECEADSEAASIFSRTNCLSPTATSVSSAASVVEDADSTPTGKHLHQRPHLQGVHSGGWGCRNCEGGAQSAVWGRLAKEREESRALRRRVEALEAAVDGALNVVDGPWGLA